MLLNVFEPTPGDGIGKRVAESVFAYLEELGPSAIAKLSAIVSDNGSDAKSACDYLRFLINQHLGREAIPDAYSIRCADHCIQLGVKESLKAIYPQVEKLRDLIKFIRNSKRVRYQYRQEASRRKEELRIDSVEPPVLDCPTRWNSTHVMCDDALKKRPVLDYIANREKDLFVYLLTGPDWDQIERVVQFLSVPRSIMEQAAKDRSRTLNMVLPTFDVLVNHAAKYAVESNEDSFLKDASKSMLTKLEKYRTVLLKEPALIANYLDPRFPKPSNPLKFEELKAMIRK